MPAYAFPPDLPQGQPCAVCSHSPHDVRDFLSGVEGSLTCVGEVCFGCPDCDRLFGLVGNVLTAARVEHEPLLA